jgi:hypothetical protein
VVWTGQGDLLVGIKRSIMSMRRLTLTVLAINAD